MTCHIIVRETLDWSRASYEQLSSPFIRDMARLWDSTFRVGYMACRARIRNIARSANLALPNARIVEPSGSDAFDLYAVENEDMVLLCDDDDWYSPLLATWLADQQRQELFILWPDAVFGCFKEALWPHFKDQAPLFIRLRPRSLDEGLFTARTNNYALTGALLRRRPDVLSKVWHHGYGGANENVPQLQLPVRRLARPLSIANRHPCSQLVLRNMARLAESYGYTQEAALRSLVTGYVHGPYMELPSSWRWAEHHIGRMRAVFEDAL